MTASPDYFDAGAEPAHSGRAFPADPCEQRVGPLDGHEDDITAVRHSVLNEPALTGTLQQAHLGRWLDEKRRACTPAGNWAVTAAAAVAGGSFAIVGAMLTGRQTWVNALYLILFAPIIEELLKQSGMIYLLEKKPYRLFTAAQFVLAAVVSALVFAAVENLLYLHLSPGRAALDPAALAAFRWTYCTSLHVVCSVIASFGLIRVWKTQCLDGRAVDLGGAFPAFAVAMGIHGAYNLTLCLVDVKF